MRQVIASNNIINRSREYHKRTGEDDKSTVGKWQRSRQSAGTAFLGEKQNTRKVVQVCQQQRKNTRDIWKINNNIRKTQNHSSDVVTIH